MARGAETCAICRDPNVYSVEEAYLMGRPIPNYSRAAVERHLAHAVDPRTLRALTDLASASGVAARLHQLAMTAAAIMDSALAADDGRLALQALKEARVTLEAMSRLSGALSDSGISDTRPDLDAALSARLGLGPESSAASADDPAPRRALPRGTAS